MKMKLKKMQYGITFSTELTQNNIYSKMYFRGKYIGETLVEFSPMARVSTHMPSLPGPGNKTLVSATIDSFHGDKELPR